MALPAVYDEHGDLVPMDDEDLYRHWARVFIQDRAGGWPPESIPGKQAIIEFEAFVRETQARAVEAFVRWWETAPWEGEVPWWVQSHAEDYAEHVRQGRVDLSGNRLA